MDIFNCLVTSYRFLNDFRSSTTEQQSLDGDAGSVAMYKTDTIHIIPLLGMPDTEVLAFHNKGQAYNFASMVEEYSKTMAAEDAVKEVLRLYNLVLSKVHK